MKKIIFAFITLIFIFSLSGCWIAPKYGPYEKIGDTYYFEDFGTMASITVHLINQSFSEWHYSKGEFSNKYNYYLNNIDKNETNYNYLHSSTYIYAVKTGISAGSVTLKDGSTIINTYYWITAYNGDSVVFYRT